MRFSIFLLIAATLFTTSCFKGAAPPITREDDKVRSDLESELKQMQLDGSIFDNEIKIAHSRIDELTISPKMYDIFKKDLYSKEKYLEQIEQQVAYLKIRINNRERYFLNNKSTLTRDALNKEYAQYSLNKKANPVAYPWRIPSATPAHDKEKTSEKKSE